MEASKPKWINPGDIYYGVNSFRLGGLHLYAIQFALYFNFLKFYSNYKCIINYILLNYKTIVASKSY